MQNLITLLNGKKTYGTVAAVFGLLFGSWQGWWKVPDEIYAALFALALGFIRAGVNKTKQSAADVPIRRILSMIALASMLTLSTGCRSAGLVSLAEHLKDDPAIVSAQISSVYGTVKFTRVGGQTNSVTVSPDGTITVNK
ncbi:MAG TPA: hypothetical protein VEH04_11345 [Verrucomicrobiae bacterium]|nr:hypothetical protein [Verrucomicrobiae bacterium]